MPLSKFEKMLPWSGLIAGLCWIGQTTLTKTDAKDAPGQSSTAVIHDNLVVNYAAVGCLVLMGIALLAFATASRNLPGRPSPVKRHTPASRTAPGSWSSPLSGRWWPGDGA